MRTNSVVAALALAVIARPIEEAPLADAVPIEVFAALPTIESLKLSPDGTKIAGKIAVEGKQMLLVQPLFHDGKPAALAQGRWDINWWSWVNDDWLVVGVGDDIVLYGEDQYFKTIISVSGDMKKLIAVDKDHLGLVADDVIWIARDGSPRDLLAKETGVEEASDWYPSVYDVDLSNGRVRLVVPSRTNVWDWAADGAGNVRYGVIYNDDGKKTGVLYRSPMDRDFQKVLLGKREEKSIPEPIAFRVDGTALALDDGEGRSSVYELQLPDFKLGKKLFGDAKYDVADVVLNSAENDLSGVGIIGHYPRIEWFDADLKEIQGGLDKTLGPGNARIVSWSRDRKKLLVEVGDPSQAGALYYWDTDDAAMQHIAWNNKVLQGRKLSSESTGTKRATERRSKRC